MGQPNFGLLNESKKVWEAGFLQEQHRCLIFRLNHFERSQNGHLHGKKSVAAFLVTGDYWAPLKNIDNVKWIWRSWIELCFKICSSVGWEVRNKGMWGNTGPVMDFGDCPGKNALGNLANLPNTTCTVVIHHVLNSDNHQTSGKQLQALYTDMRYWEELINLIKNNCDPKEPYYLIAVYKCTFQQE